MTVPSLALPSDQPLSRAEILDYLRRLRDLTPEARRLMLAGLPRPCVEAILEEWWWQARGGQIEPEAGADGAPWRVWAIVAGRGFGKTRAGAEWVWARVREGTVTGNCPQPLRIALVGSSLDEVARVMVEGESGLLAIARGDEEPRWLSSRGLLLFPSGAEAHAFTAEKPDKLRGPQHHFAWCDELAKWPNADSTWDNLMLGLRLGEAPRTIVTTTPRPVPALKRILALRRCVQTHGRTADNPHSAPDFRAAMEEMYAGTRLGRQELDGLLLDDFEGALWTREIIEKARASRFLPGTGRGTARSAVEGAPGQGTVLVRIVIGLDPPATAAGDSCGIVVCGKDEDGVAYVLADLTVHGLRPEGWARRVARAAELWDAQRIVAEKNQGGDMVESVLRAAEPSLPVKLVHASKGKIARAEPIALRFETGEARLAGGFPELEDELCAITYAGYQGPGSPDRADAMVWAMTELFEKERAEPRIRAL